MNEEYEMMTKQEEEEILEMLYPNMTPEEIEEERFNYIE